MIDIKVQCNVNLIPHGKIGNFNLITFFNNYIRELLVNCGNKTKNVIATLNSS
jgi:hypothetical protein